MRFSGFLVPCLNFDFLSQTSPKQEPLGDSIGVAWRVSGGTGGIRDRNETHHPCDSRAGLQNIIASRQLIDFDENQPTRAADAGDLNRITPRVEIRHDGSVAGCRRQVEGTNRGERSGE